MKKPELRGLLERARRPRNLRALSVLFAGLLLGELNLAGARHFRRWDASSDSRFTLSNATLDLLHVQKSAVRIVSLLAKSDPMYVEARHVLDAYLAESPLISTKFIDPDRDVAEFRALAQRLEIDSATDETGGTVPSAAFLIESGSRRWFVPQSQLASREDDGRGRNLLENRLTTALAHVAVTRRERICFVTGHGERSIEDLGPEGLGELARRLTQSNLDADRVPLDVPDPRGSLDTCDVVAVVAPERPWPEQHARLLAGALAERANLLLFADPLVNERAQLVGPGLEPVLELLGARFQPGFVIEHDPARRLPRGMGEAFFAEVEGHVITRGLSTEGARLDARPVLVAAQPLRFESAPGRQPLLRSSSSSTLLSQLSGAPDASGVPQSYVLAAAFELPQFAGSPGRPSRLGRAVVVGAANMASADSFREPNLFANRTFVENAVSWLAERPSLVSVPERPAHEAGLVLSEDSLNELLRYVLVYMPVTAGLLGILVLLRRNSRQARSRKEAS